MKETIPYHDALPIALKTGSTVEKVTAEIEALNLDPSEQVAALRASLDEVAKCKEQMDAAIARNRVALDLQSEFEQKVEAHDTFAREIQSVVQLHEWIKEFTPQQISAIDGLLANQYVNVQDKLNAISRLIDLERADVYVAKRLPALRKQFRESEAELKALADKHGVKI